MAGLVEMVVESVRVHMLSSQHVVILKEFDRDRYLPIWIGPWEANAIAMRLQGIAADRPLTHDLFAAAVEELGGEIRQVVISDLADDTFHARLFLAIGERTIEIDSRPSDALALAVRSGARIFAEPADAEPVTGPPDVRTTKTRGPAGSRVRCSSDGRSGRARTGSSIRGWTSSATSSTRSGPDRGRDPRGPKRD